MLPFFVILPFSSPPIRPASLFGFQQEDHKLPPALFEFLQLLMSNGGACFLFYTLAPNRVLFLSVHLPLSRLCSPFLYFFSASWKASLYLLACFLNPLYKLQSLIAFSLAASWVASKNGRKKIGIDHEKRNAGKMSEYSSFWRSQFKCTCKRRRWLVFCFS